jgi:hypothetical protein
MDHAAEALRLLNNAAMNTTDDNPGYEDWEERNTLALVGIGHALLDVAAAIREQTAGLLNDGLGVRTVSIG